MAKRPNRWIAAGEMNMENNFIALVPRFKFERHPTFVVTCDTFGLSWLRERFVGLADAKRGSSFVVGDGVEIASDHRCKLTVIRTQEGRESEISKLGPTEFIWSIDQIDAAAAADKLSSLIASNIAGHQYVEVEHGRYRMVVFTKDEYHIDTIRAMRDGRMPED
jgi:hypothetical protein